MALAYLLRNMQDEGLVPDHHMTAFIVDHRARENSTEEARTVSDWLGEMGGLHP